MHTDIGHTAGILRTRRSFAQTLSAYARLGNMKVYIQWLGPLIAWSLTTDPFGLSPAAVAALALFTLACLTGAAAGGTLDDVQGFRDGIDQRTYGAADTAGGFQAKSDSSIKPLVTGELTDAEAHRFGIGIGLISVVLGTAAILVAPESPWWLLALWPLWVLGSSQYGYGLKASYHGAAELLLGILIAATVWFPLVFLEGELTWTGAVVAYLIGTLLSQVTLFSMVHDREADAAAGRRTLAVRLSPRAYEILLAAWIGMGWVVAAIGFAAGALDGWLMLAWLPVWAVQVGQLVYGVVRAEPLIARRLGWHAFDVAIVTFMLVNLLAR